MKRYLNLWLLFLTLTSWSQTDFSSSWEDFYSYNNVKDFIKVDTKIYAVTDNAIFIYDTVTQEIQKLSSVQGLTGETTTSIYFSKTFHRLIIGYQTGLLEIVDADGKITVANDIERLTITGEKEIKHITEFNNKLYLSTPFAVVVYDIENLQFGDTYFIGNNSTTVSINQIAVFNDVIYAATEIGIFTADANARNLIDFNNWQQPQDDFLGNFKTIEIFNSALFTAKSNTFYKINTATATLQQLGLLANMVLDLKTSDAFITATTRSTAYVYDTSLNQVAVANATQEFPYILHTAMAENNTIYLGTTLFGILQRSFSNDIEHIEIHPEGPSSNDIFSITAENNNLWVVYGGYDGAFTPLQRALGFSHFNGEEWINIPYNPAFPARDLVHITIDPNEENKVYISSWGQTNTGQLDATGGILVVENDQPTIFLNHTNSGLEDLAPNNPNYHSVRINGTAFDNRGNLWVANAWIDKKLKKMAPNGTWSEFDLSTLQTNEAFGLTEVAIDRTGSIWIGTRRNGVYVYNETGDRKRALVTEATKGSLPDPNTRSIVIDRNNRIWIGTKKGLVVYSNAGGIFDADIYDAAPIIIDDDGIPKKLLGDQPVNTIAIDGADNKWFGTDTGGVLATNPSGRETLFNFNKENSPLPSNKIIKIKVDNSNGKVFFATNKGIVAFNNNVAPFGDTLGEVYAYPNPVKKEHAFVTIDGRNGTHLPRGTNVKILDAAGRLVHETNVVEGQELKGGKVIWDKTNLAGTKVASGVYIVLLTLPDRSETSITKIAIIN